jgi:hypothetical protein
VLALALVAGACTGASDESPQRTIELAGGARLHAAAGALSGDAELIGGVTGPRDDLPAVPGLPVAGSVDITTSVQPTAPVVVEIPVPPSSFADLPPGADQTILVLHKPDGAEWEPLEGQLDRARGVVSVTTASLSPLSALITSTSELRKTASELLDGYLGGVDFRTDQPNCADESKVREAGYSIQSTSSDFLRWCLGAGPDGKPELKMVLNRPYPAVASLGRSLTIRENAGGALPVALAQAATDALGQPGEITLSPGGTTTVAIDLPAQQTTRLHAEFDGFAQALVSLQVAAELLAQMAKHMRFGGAVAADAKEALDLLDTAVCIPKLMDVAADPGDAGRLGAMISACLKPEYFLHSTAKVVLLTLGQAVGAAGGVLAYILSSGRALLDQVRGQGSYDITLHRTASSGQTMDLAVLWTRWQELNDACRGDGDDAACGERDEIMKQHAYASAAQFLAAWKAQDAQRMRELSTPDAQMLSDPLVPSLLATAPAEDKFDMRYDVYNTGKVGGYISVASGSDLYFEWADDYQKGWLIKSVAPDVG